MTSCLWNTGQVSCCIIKTARKQRLKGFFLTIYSFGEFPTDNNMSALYQKHPTLIPLNASQHQGAATLAVCVILILLMNTRTRQFNGRLGCLTPVESWMYTFWKLRVPNSHAAPFLFLIIRIKTYKCIHVGKGKSESYSYDYTLVILQRSVSHSFT